MCVIELFWNTVPRSNKFLPFCREIFEQKLKGGGSLPVLVDLHKNTVNWFTELQKNIMYKTLLLSQDYHVFVGFTVSTY